MVPVLIQSQPEISFVAGRNGTDHIDAFGLDAVGVDVHIDQFKYFLFVLLFGDVEFGVGQQAGVDQSDYLV